MRKEKFRVRLAKWLLKDEAFDGRLASVETDVPMIVKSNSIDRHQGTVNFTIHPASGGYVVETTCYDSVKDRHHRSLHIITSQEDFTEELGKVVFMDLLKNR